MNRRLYRCQHDRRIAGVAAGLAEYFDIDPTVVRVLWVLSFFVGGVGLLLYIAMAIIVPLEPEHGPMTTGYGPTSGIPGPGDAPGAGPGTETGPDGAPVPSAIARPTRPPRPDSTASPLRWRPRWAATTSQ